jgi:hypothetical protein
MSATSPECEDSGASAARARPAEGNRDVVATRPGKSALIGRERLVLMFDRAISHPNAIRRDRNK